jgi:hypothetical protein
MDGTRFEETRDQLLLDNKPSISQTEIKYIGWLTRNAPTKATSSVIIEFSKPEDANRIIDEGLAWQGEIFQCERYKRQCRVKQCFKCQHYGQVGTQCKSTTACGYCAQEHESRACPSKLDRTVPKRCATCRGEHEAWSYQCPTRKEEKAKARAAYDRQPYYHPVVQMADSSPPLQTSASASSGEAQQAGKRAAGAAADREDRTQRLPLQPRRPDRYQPQMQLRREAADGRPHPPPLQQATKAIEYMK